MTKLSRDSSLCGISCDDKTHLNLSIMARIIRSRRLVFAAAGHCTPDISISGGGKSGNRRRPLLPCIDDERIESGSLSVSDGDAVKSLYPRPLLPNSCGPLGVLAGVFCCGGVAANNKQCKYANVKYYNLFLKNITSHLRCKVNVFNDCCCCCCVDG